MTWGGVSHQGHVRNDVQKDHHKGQYSCMLIIEPDTYIIYESEVILKEITIFSPSFFNK